MTINLFGGSSDTSAEGAEEDINFPVKNDLKLKNNMVSWCSWLSRQSNTLKVSVSSAIEQACAASRFLQLCASAPPSPRRRSTVDLSLAALSSYADARAIRNSSAAPTLPATASLSLADYRLGGAFLRYVKGTQQVTDAMASLYALANLTGRAAAPPPWLPPCSATAATCPCGLWTPPQTERDGYWPPDVPTAKASERVVVAAAAASEAWSPNVTVGEDGGGCQFTMVQAAVDAAPSQKKKKKAHAIYIKQGIYAETVRVPLEKPNLAFVGDGMGKTIITGFLNVGVPGVSTYNTVTVGITGDGFNATRRVTWSSRIPAEHLGVYPVENFIQGINGYLPLCYKTVDTDIGRRA
ncbi:uncharacterized protein LOC121972834 [Zingiber officinale]|uniref:uncharacterized protein LOC121972834 n=1 Tax=Zingiber officinale TaxID=94328 RepID=UPI001C4B008A|nr:uncharacterized protein LOC121972834 [Zingiber officinale]